MFNTELCGLVPAIEKEEFALSVLFSVDKMAFEAIAGGVGDGTEAMGELIVV